MVVTIFLELEEVIAVHHDQITRYGGSHGIRQLDLLISAVSRSQATFGGKDLYPTLYLKVASLIHSLIFNHPFIDGNKRTAMVSGARFLYVNNHVLMAKKHDIVDVALKVESKKWDLDKLAQWLQENSKRI